MTKGLISDPVIRQQRIELKKQRLLSWLVDFTWTTPSIAGQVMGLQARSAIHKTLNMFEQQGLIRHSQIPFLMGRDITVFGITIDGLLWCDNEDDQFNSKPVFDPARVSISTFQHRLDVQRCRLKITEMNVTKWLAENNLPKSLSYRPDAIIHNTDLNVALELERSAKTRKRYQQIIVQHLRQIKQGHYTQVHYVSTIDGFAERLQRLFHSISMVSVKGQQVLFTDDLKSHFKFFNFNDWEL